VIDIDKIRKKDVRSNSKKTQQLGIPYGTANGRLRKMVIFDLLKRHSENICFRCKKEIEKIDDLSIEHKEPWLDKDIALFWDMSNIAFSHLSCNCANGRKPSPQPINHGKYTGYTKQRCRCPDCTKAHREHIKDWRLKTGKH
jgi:hypothetical protein